MPGIDPTSSSCPRLSVVLGPDSYDTIRPVIRALERQSNRQSIEIVLVLPEEAQSGVRMDDLHAFAGCKILTVDSMAVLAPARAAGIRVASAPIVFIGETHVYPQPGWAEALLAAFEDPWTAVVPAIDNANPTGAVSWAAYLFDYGAWGGSRPAGEMSDPLIYNTAYRRAPLVALADHLEQALDPNHEALWLHLRAEGHRAWFAPEARVRHLNVGKIWALILEKFCVGSVFGTRRASRWSWPRRILDALGSPLIAIVLVGRVVRGSRRSRPRTLPAGTMPMIIVSAVAKAAGELLGYLGLRLQFTEARLTEIELHKVQYAGRKTL